MNGPTQFRRAGDADDTLMEPKVLRELAEAGVIRDAKLVFVDQPRGWVVELYSVGRWRRLKMWDKAQARVFKDANSAVRQMATLGMRELRIDLTSVSDPDLLTRAKREKKTRLRSPARPNL